MKEYKYKINGNVYKVGIGDIDNGIAEVEVNGTPYKVELEKKDAPTIKVATPKAAAAPDTVVTLEAMKMENSIKAGVDGKIASISVGKGESVLEGAVLVTIA